MTNYRGILYQSLFISYELSTTPHLLPNSQNSRKAKKAAEGKSSGLPSGRIYAVL